MKLRSIALAVAALSAAATPAIAQATFERSNAPVEGENELSGSAGVIIAILAATAVVAGIIVASDNEQDESPSSP